MGGEKLFYRMPNLTILLINFSDASLGLLLTGDDIFGSPSFEDSSGVNIFFGSDDGNVYAVDVDGNSLSGFH